MWTTEAIGELYRQHSYAVFRRCRRLLGDEREAQEMVQEVFLQLLEEPGRFKRRSKASTYLYAIATHRCLNRIRDRAARGPQWRAQVAQHLAVHDESSRPDRALAARQIVDLVMENTDEKTSEIALYHYADGLSQGEIAKLVGLSRITVNKRLRALRRQALELAEEVRP